MRMSAYFLLKTCRHCQRPHHYQDGDFTPRDYCDVCSSDRRARAAEVFGAPPAPIVAAELTGPFLLSPGHALSGFEIATK